MFDELKEKLGLTDFLFKSLRKGLEVQNLILEYQALDGTLNQYIQGLSFRSIVAGDENTDQVMQNLDPNGELTNITNLVVNVKAKIMTLDNGSEKEELETQLKELEQQQTKHVLNLAIQRPELMNIITSVNIDEEDKKNILRKKRDDCYIRLVIKIAEALDIPSSKIDSLDMEQFENILRAVANETKNRIPDFFIESVNQRNQNPNRPIFYQG
jgi:hypothetical protein